MILPEADRAFVDQAKVVEYLLSSSHPDGKSKAQFFLRFGFRSEEWRVLAEALRGVGVSNPVGAEVKSQYGMRYTVDGPLRCPDGRTPKVRTVWISKSGSPGPRLITAYPMKEQI